MKRLIVLIGLCLLVQPQAVQAAAKTHPATPENQECSACHAEQENIWFNSKHGLMGVKCTVCHGTTDKDFIVNPGIAACRGCHAEEVGQALKAKKKEEKRCFPCHIRHALTVQDGVARPYHAQGGKQP